jgi:phage/plasmid-like protein (TIGR03299 family)
MAHNLATTKDGKAAMMYTGEAPWHKLGTKLENPATAAEAIIAAGLDYQVQLARLFTQEGNQVPRRQGVIRSDTNQILGTVGQGYTPIQNSEAFQFLDAIVADGGLRYHTAGALGKGERVWMLAKLPGHIRVKGTDDLTEKFLLLHNSHDGSSCLRVHFTPIRVVCQNTLAIAERNGRGQGISIMHKGDLETKVHEAQKVLGLANRFFDDLQPKIDLLAGYLPNRDQLSEFFGTLYPDPEGGNSTRAENVRAELFRLFDEGIGQDILGIRHSAWAALHAVEGDNVVVSLLTADEVAELELQDEERLCGDCGLHFISFPIPDRGVPFSMSETSQVVDLILDELWAGKAVVVHCRMGIGRSALIAACLLKSQGIGVDEAFAMISLARGLTTEK